MKIRHTNPLHSLLLLAIIISGLVSNLVVHAESTEIDICKGQLSRFAELRLSGSSSIPAIKGEIDQTCLERFRAIPYVTKTELETAAEDLWQDHFSEILISKYLINLKLSSLNGFVSEEMQSDAVKYIEARRESVDKVTDNYLGTLHSYVEDYYVVAIAYDYINNDFLEFDLYAGYQRVLTKSGKICEDYSDIPACECFQNYKRNERDTCDYQESVEIIPEETPATSDISSFVDLSSSHQNRIAIEYLKNNGIISGYPDGTFKPDHSLNRAELLKILVEGKGVSPTASEYKNCFPDVKEEWYAKYVCYAKQQGWIAGYPDGTFRPSANVNKAEAIKMLLEVFGVLLSEQQSKFADVPSSEWFSSYITTAESMDLLEESGLLYEPGKEISRGKISESLYRLIK